MEKCTIGESACVVSNSSQSKLFIFDAYAVVELKELSFSASPILHFAKTKENVLLACGEDQFVYTIEFVEKDIKD